MGPVKLVLDSDVLILALNRRPLPSIDALLNGEEELAVSVVTWMEVMADARVEHEADTRRFLTRFTLQELTPAIAETAVRVRKESRLKWPDAIVYATALAVGLSLIHI